VLYFLRLWHYRDMNKPAKMKPTAQKVRENSIGWMLKMLCGRLDSDMTKELQQLGLNLGQFAVLMTLLEEEGLTQAEIGSKIVMPGYATTRNIDALEVMQIVERRKDERSRRSYRIHLTGQGHKIGPKLFKTVGNINEKLLSPLDASEQKQFLELLQKVL
ncbi:MAG: MarR family transcriptional regulator, partial [Pseudomonadota bacterium]|nr:MarR family transcriptional regulator [Pseudomonadota bacterium]